MTYLVPFNHRAITMTCDAEGSLHAFRWGKDCYTIAQVASTWRIDDGWWILRRWNEYYLVTTHEKFLFLLYRDLITNLWFVERVYN